MSDDPYDLDRFVRAQAGHYMDALDEVRSGRKRSHWMWFVFPQLEGLGSSDLARNYAITGAAEAQAYLAHPVLGPRLRECCEAVFGVEGRTAREIFGGIDEMKLRSCVTLFASVSPPGSLFEAVLEKFFAGRPDPRTLDLLAAARQ